MKRILLITGIILLSSLMGKAQISEGGEPAGFRDMSWQTEVREIVLQKPEFPEPDASEAYLKPERIGISIPVEIDFFREANQYIESGKTIYRLAIRSEGAKALGVYYDAFVLPGGTRLFLYNKDRSKLIGAFTNRNNRHEKAFATEPLAGDLFYIELEVPAGKENEVRLNISEISWYYKDINGFGDSGPCEVNVNCPEGDNWRDQINGIARIIVKANGGQFWCTGSLINNTRLDNKPYFFTADHCGKNASQMDYLQWIFYFNYESEDCTNPTQQPESKTMVGAVVRARSEYGTSLGSDFKLLELDEQVPITYNPFFNGWSRSNAPSGSGVTIHHPQGDIKKISTYKDQLLSTPYASGSEDPNEKYWRVVWSETQSNHGVTEGGSSGAPIFNTEKKIIGALTGGTASCDNLLGPDYYGKFWYSWESNGGDDAHQLAPWLDPDNTGVESIPGITYDQDVVVADFQAHRDTVAVGSFAAFKDISIGEPTKWEWRFEGGEPSTSNEQNPAGITYASVGQYNVELIASNDVYSDTLLRKKMITVKPLISPNPVVKDVPVEIFLGSSDVNRLQVFVYNKLGRLMTNYEFSNVSGKVELDLFHFAADLYLIQLIADGAVSTHKLVLAY